LENRNEIRALHPGFHQQIDGVGAIPENMPQLELTSDNIKIALRSVNMDSSSGPTPWTYSLIKQICDDEQELGLVTNLFNMIAAGRAGLTCWWNESEIIPFARPGKAARPIAVSNCWMRILSRTVAAKFMDYSVSKLQPFQYGVGVRSGMEHIIHLSQTMADHIRTRHAGQEEYLVQLDCTNAFNTISRKAIFDKLLKDESLRPLARFIQWSYGDRVPLYDRKGCIFVCYAECGVRQGDPLGSMFFVFGIQQILEHLKRKYPNIDIAAYLDNIF
jgi:hypothetical protein